MLRYLHDRSWKTFSENLNDAKHPTVAHESSAGMAKRLWNEIESSAPAPMVIEQFVPIVNGYEVREKMRVKVYENGRRYSGVSCFLHSRYSSIGEYERAMTEAYGEERAHRILGEARHNTVYCPSFSVKGCIQAIRVARPLAVDKTLIESWTARQVEAPDELLSRTTTYMRLVNSPTLVVGHDDLQCYRSIQEGVTSGSNDWVSLHRNYSRAEEVGVAGTYGETNEVSMRGQYRALLRVTEKPLETQRAPHAFQWLSDNGSAYSASRRSTSLSRYFIPVRSSRSMVMAECS